MWENTWYSALKMGDIGQVISVTREEWPQGHDYGETSRNQITTCYKNWYCICHVYIANGIYQYMSLWLFEKMHSRNRIETKVQGEKCLFSETYINFFLKNKNYVMKHISISFALATLKH